MYCRRKPLVCDNIVLFVSLQVQKTTLNNNHRHSLFKLNSFTSVVACGPCFHHGPQATTMARERVNPYYFFKRPVSFWWRGLCSPIANHNKWNQCTKHSASAILKHCHQVQVTTVAQSCHGSLTVMAGSYRIRGRLRLITAGHWRRQGGDRTTKVNDIVKTLRDTFCWPE